MVRICLRRISAQSNRGKKRGGGGTLALKHTAKNTGINFLITIEPETYRNITCKMHRAPRTTGGGCTLFEDPCHRYLFLLLLVSDVPRFNSKVSSRQDGFITIFENFRKPYVLTQINSRLNAHTASSTKKLPPSLPEGTRYFNSTEPPTSPC